VGGRWVFDLVVVGVVFAGLQWGPVAGILSGTMGGLMQDVLSGEIVGVGGVAKTVVGCAAGAVGAQFVLVKPSARMLIVAGSTLVHRVIVLSLYGMIEQQWPVVRVGPMLGEIGINSIREPVPVSCGFRVARRDGASAHQPPVEPQPQTVVVQC
jgi:rod shape-determining protein MreD